MIEKGELTAAVLGSVDKVQTDEANFSTPRCHVSGGALARSGWLTRSLLIALLAGFALRLILLNTYPLREDEALYGYWARSFLSDLRYLTVFPDKPPLYLWLQSLALSLFGADAAGARILSILASTATIALAAAGARLVWASNWIQRTWAWAAAAWLIALNPFAVAFGATGYTDSLLVLWGTAAIVTALRGRLLWAGALVGAAIVTKQQGLFYLPLVLALALVVHQGKPSASAGAPVRALGLVVAGCALVVAPVMAWDASRWSVAPSPWDLGVQNYTSIGFASLVELANRGREWLQLLWFGAASFWAWGMLAVLAGIGMTGYLRMLSHRSLTSEERWAPPLLLGWMLCFLAAHLFSTVAPWDRYLLPIYPVLAILLAGGVGMAAEWMLHPPAGANPLVRALMAGTVVLLLGVLASPAVQAARGALPLGGDHGDYAGLDEAARWVETQAAEGEHMSVYHRALGWNLQFSLYDVLRDRDVNLRWFPNGVYLADNVTKNPGRRAIVIEPDWATTRDIVQQTRVRGLSVNVIARFGKMTVLELVAEPEWCDWCSNRLPIWQIGPSGPMSTIQTNRN